MYPDISQTWAGFCMPCAFGEQERTMGTWAEIMIWDLLQYFDFFYRFFSKSKLLVVQLLSAQELSPLLLSVPRSPWDLLEPQDSPPSERRDEIFSVICEFLKEKARCWVKGIITQDCAALEHLRNLSLNLFPVTRSLSPPCSRKRSIPFGVSSHT